MATVLALPSHPTTLDEDAWDDLLNFIEERRVVPIIGPGLLKVATERGPRLLYDWIAEKLAAKLQDAVRLALSLILEEHKGWRLAMRMHRLKLG